MATACSGEELATRWVHPEAAVVRCTTAGRHRMPPVLLDLPIPAVPTGLLARQLDPMALNDMGFERDQPVCASLARPSEETLDGARGRVDGLLVKYRETGANARAALGRCTCDVARAMGVAELLAPCHDVPHRKGCEVTPEAVVQLNEQLAPLREALATTPIPRLHWRVAGRSDRPGWMVKRLTQLLPRHAGGVTAFHPGQAIPSRHNHVLIRRLLDVPGTVLVLRLDGGRSVMLVREIDGAQVLDLLTFPPIEPRMMPLLSAIDEAQAEQIAAAVTQPPSRWSPPLALDKGNIVHLDRASMQALDSLRLAMAPLAGNARAPTLLPTAEDEPLVDSITLQADFGTKGKRLRARAALSSAGVQWAQTLSDGQLGTQIDLLGLPMEAPPLAPTVDDVSLMFHRSATERLVLDGLWHAAGFLRSLEMVHPNSVQGSPSEWDVALPPGAIAPGGTVPPPLELRDWAGRIAQEPYRLRSSFDTTREHFMLVLEPE